MEIVLISAQWKGKTLWRYKCLFYGCQGKNFDFINNIAHVRLYLWQIEAFKTSTVCTQVRLLARNSILTVLMMSGCANQPAKPASSLHPHVSGTWTLQLKLHKVWQQSLAQHLSALFMKARLCPLTAHCHTLTRTYTRTICTHSCMFMNTHEHAQNPDIHTRCDTRIRSFEMREHCPWMLRHTLAALFLSGSSSLSRRSSAVYSLSRVMWQRLWIIWTLELNQKGEKVTGGSQTQMTERASDHNVLVPSWIT